MTGTIQVPVIFYPADDGERRRMLTQVFDNRLILAPVQWGDRDMVLEVGAAGGAWLTEVVQELSAHANIQFHGIDIEARLFPAQPPPNTSYSVISVLELPETWADRFTYVHQRLLMGALTDSQWPSAVQELHRVTKPGGWVELNEGLEYYEHPKNRDCHRVFDILGALCIAQGVKPNIGKELANLLADAGFVDITTVHKKILLGRLGGELGQLAAQCTEGFFRAIKKQVLPNDGLGLVKTGEEFDKLIDDLVEDWNTVPGYSWDQYISYARKPSSEQDVQDA